MSKSVSLYFLEKCKDTDIRLIEYDLSIITKNLQEIEDIFNSVNFLLPIGLTEEDVHEDAGKLYSDVFMLHYVKIKSKFELINYCSSRSLCAREDVIKHFNSCIDSELDISNRADDILLSKGLFIRSPYIPIPERVEFVKKQSFMDGFVGDERPMQSREIGFAFINTQTNALGEALLMGFSQVAKDKKVQGFMSIGKETFRRDMNLTYTRLMAEVNQYLDDGAKIMIDNNWLESPPQAPKRKELQKV